MLGENTFGQTPSVAELQEWADTFDITHPVVADPGWGVTVGYTGYSIALPSMHLLADGLTVVERATWVSEQDVVNHLP